MRFILSIPAIMLDSVNSFCGSQNYDFEALPDGRSIQLRFLNQRSRDDVEGYISRLRSAMQAMETL